MAPGHMMMVKDRPNISQWSIENGYGTQSNENEYPYRVSNSGNIANLFTLLTVEKENLEYVCSVLGFRVILGAPGDTLKVSEYSFRVSLTEESYLSVKPKLITTADELRDYHPIRRQCFYSSERQLRFFKKYSQNNCEAECLANFTKIECGCVKFHMPSKNQNHFLLCNHSCIVAFFGLGDRSTKTCGASSINCYRNAEQKLFEAVGLDSSKNVGKSFLNRCNCLPACTSIEYDADLESIKVDSDVLLRSHPDLNTS